MRLGGFLGLLCTVSGALAAATAEPPPGEILLLTVALEEQSALVPRCVCSTRVTIGRAYIQLLLRCFILESLA